MKFSLNWLSRHVPLNDLSIDEITNLLTFAGVEVEGIHTSGVQSDLIIIARVISFEPHPNADRLRLCQVDDGSGTPRQIVCGAQNFKANDLVPLALPGANMPAGFTIKPSKLRGIMSDGMLCAGAEIGIPDCADGLLILPHDAPIGKPIQERFTPDVMLDLEITPNRPDLLSHNGLARELASLTKRAVTPPTIQPQTQICHSSKIRIEAESCPYYTARIIRGVKIAPSPKWIADSLLSISLRPINQLVDITNFLLHDLGHPLHVFDLNKLHGDVVIRHATEGEPFIALDEKTYILTTRDLVIADDSGPIAIAGVMGGLHSSVTDATTDILLESAWFTPARIRETSRRLNLMSTSSYRFERIADASLVDLASHRATEMITLLAGGVADDALIASGTPPVQTPEVNLHGDHVRRLLGSPTTNDQIDSILHRLGLHKTSPDTWLIPPFRPDLRRPVDLIEEVARVQGLDPIPALTRSFTSPPSPADTHFDRVQKIRKLFVNLGLHETRTLKLISPALVETNLAFDESNSIGMRNPLGEEHSRLRPAIIPGLLQVAAHNFRNSANYAAYFETGTVFLPDSTETLHAAFILAGPSEPESWLQPKPSPYNWHHITGILSRLTNNAALTFLPISRPNYAPAAHIFLGDTLLGVAGQLISSRVKNLVNTREAVFVCELDLNAIVNHLSTPKSAQTLPRFPDVTRDVAMEVPRALPHAQLAHFFASQKHTLLVDKHMFDLFIDDTGEKLPADRKSIAYRLHYQAPDRTLQSQEVDTAHAEILAALVRDLPVVIR